MVVVMVLVSTVPSAGLSRSAGRGAELDLEVDRADAVSRDPLGGEAIRIFNRQGGQGPLDAGQIRAQIDQGSEEHIAGDAAEGVEVEVSAHKTR